MDTAASRETFSDLHDVENEEYEATNSTDFQRKVSVRKTINLSLEISCYTSIALTAVVGSGSGHSNKLTDL